MRLGAQACHIVPNTLAAMAYGATKSASAIAIVMSLIKIMSQSWAAAGLVISAKSEEAQLVEMVEWPDHPWGLGCQFHPEYKSRVGEPHPLFVNFIEVLQHKDKRSKDDIGNINSLDQPMVLMAGPCVLESYELNFSVAQTLKQIAEAHGVNFIFKSSFEKANAVPFQVLLDCHLQKH